MPQFIAKPVQVEAQQFTGSNAQSLMEWLRVTPQTQPPGGQALVLTDGIEAKINDWIVQDQKGTFFVVPEADFPNEYEPAE